MLHEVFYWLFNMSISATVVGIAVLLLRKISQIPKGVSVLLWLAPFLRMCIPLGLSYPYSLMSLLSRLRMRTVLFLQPAEGIEFSAANYIMAAEDYFPITYKVDILKDVFTVAAIVWLIVMVGIVIALTVLYVTTLREMKDSQPLGDGVYCSPKVTSPAVYGILRPKIILPQGLLENRYVLLHEKAHIRRGDNLWRMIGFAAAAVHWFNPFAWIFLKQFLGDLELACDAYVLRALPEEEVKAYAHSLLDSGESANVFVSAFGGTAIRTRVEHILSFQKMTWLASVGFAALLGAIFSILLTNTG